MIHLKVVVYEVASLDAAKRDEVVDVVGHVIPAIGDQIAMPAAMWHVRWRRFELDGTMTIGVEEFARP